MLYFSSLQSWFNINVVDNGVEFRTCPSMIQTKTKRAEKLLILLIYMYFYCLFYTRYFKNSTQFSWTTLTFSKEIFEHGTLLRVPEYLYSGWVKYLSTSSTSGRTSSQQQLIDRAVLQCDQLMIDCQGNRPIHSAAAANAAAGNVIGFGSCSVQQEQQNTSNQLLQFCLGHSPTLIHFTLLHTCSVFFFLWVPSITLSWSNCSDGEVREELPGAVWLLYLWPSVSDLWSWIGSQQWAGGATWYLRATPVSLH